MTKSFTIIKIGYTAGIYGCSGEYFNVFITGAPRKKKENTDFFRGFFFQGMYGAEQRVAGALKAKGYTEKYSQSVYGQLKRKDIPKGRFLSEYEAIDLVKFY